MAQQIKNILQDIIKPKESWKLKLLANWPEIIGNLADKVTVEKVNDDHLVLGVFDSSWMQELYMLSPLLIRTINKKLDAPRIKNVRFKHTTKKKKKKVESHKTKTPKHVTLKKWEQRALDDIEDESLRAALKNFLVRCYQEK